MPMSPVVGEAEVDVRAVEADDSLRCSVPTPIKTRAAKTKTRQADRHRLIVLRSLGNIKSDLSVPSKKGAPQPRSRNDRSTEFSRGLPSPECTFRVSEGVEAQRS